MKNLYLLIFCITPLLLSNLSPAQASSSDYPYSTVNHLPTGSQTDTTPLPLSHWTTQPEISSWQQISQGAFAKYANYWQLEDLEPIPVSVTNEAGQPLANADVQLLDQNGTVRWQAKTNQQGQAMLWLKRSAISPQGENKRGETSTTWKGENNTTSQDFVARGKELTLKASYQNQHKKPIPLKAGKNQMTLSLPCQQLQGADIAFLLDATNSMRDEFTSILPKLKATGHPILLARDYGERYLVKSMENDGNAFTQRAGGGGDDTEAIDRLLLAALKHHEWDANAPARLLIYCTDALPHHSEGAPARLQEAIRLANEKGVTILPIAASGLNEEGEYLLQALALMTGGTYAWLEDTPGNPNLHRTPLLQLQSHTTTLKQWLATTHTQNEKLDLCTPLKPEAAAASTKVAAALRCFPNPAVRQSTLELPKGEHSIRIFNSEGKLQANWNKVSDPLFTFSVADWPAGMYWVEVDGVGKVKLVVQ